MSKYTTIQTCKYRTRRVYTCTNIQIYIYIRMYTYGNLHTQKINTYANYEYTNIALSKYTLIQIYKYTNIQLYTDRENI